MANFELGNLVWRVTGDTRDFDKGLNKANKKAQKFGGGLKKAFLGLGGILATVGIAKFGKSLIKAASDGEEVAQKFGVVFKSVKGTADVLANELANGYGLAKTESKALLADTADLLQGFGITGEKSLELSGNVNKLAVDLASFSNFSGGAEGASAALTKALLGESESAKALGIAITQTELKKMAEDQGLVFNELTRGEKALLTYELAVKQSQNAIGDFARSQSSFANQSRIAQSRIKDIQGVLGNGLLPIANVGVTLFNEFSKTLLETAESLRDFATSAEGSERIGEIFGNIAGVLTIVKNVAVLLFDGLREGLGDVLEPFGKLKGEIGNTGTAFTIFGAVITGVVGGLRIVGEITKGTIDNLVNLGLAVKTVGAVVADFTGLLTGKVTFEEFKEGLAEVGDSFEAFGKGVVDNTKAVIEETASIIGEFSANTEAAAKKFQDDFTKASDAIKGKVTGALRAADEQQKKNNETQAVTQEETEKTETGFKKLTETLNILGVAYDATSSFLSALNALSAASTDARIADLDRQLEAELAAAGLSEETTLQKLEKEKQAAIEAGDSELAAEKQRDIDRQTLTEKFEKQKAKAEYQGALTSWKLNLALAAVDTARAITKAIAGSPLTFGLPWSAFAAASGIVQGAAIAKSRPKKPSFAEGGLVPRLPGVPLSGDNQPANLNPDEMVLNKTQQKRLLALANGAGSGGSSVVVNQYNTLNTDSESNLQKAARALFPALQTEGVRRG